MTKNRLYAIVAGLIIIFAGWGIIQFYRDRPPDYPKSAAADTLVRPTKGEYQFQSQGSNFSAAYKKNPGEKRAIRFQTKNSAINFFTPALAQAKTEPQINGSSLIYPQINPGLDLRYTNQSKRLLEEFVVNSYEKALEWQKISQTVELENIDRWREENGGIVFESAGQTVATVPTPVMYEADHQEQRSYGIEYQIQSLKENQLNVTKTINDKGLAWLADPNRQYPIVIDLVIDNADTAGNWISSNTNLLTVAQETTIKQEGTGSVKLYPTNWYNFSWSYRTKLTIEADYVDADLTDFPVYVNLANLPSGFHSHVNQTDARDIRVTKSDGVTELPREVVFYDSSTDTGELHFKYTGTLSGSTDTDVYIYYGNASASDYAATDTYGRNNVWSNHIAVLHLNEAADNSCASGKDACDSSGNNINFDDSGGSTAGVTAKLNKGRAFDGNDDQLSTAYNSVMNTSSFTVSLWFNADTWSSTEDPGLIARRQSYSTMDWQFYRQNWSGCFEMSIGESGASTLFGDLCASPSTGTWQYLTFKKSGTTYELFLDGVSKGTNTNSTTWTDSEGIYLGAISTYNFDGLLDEVRYENVARSSTWISTTYKNQNSPSTFFNSFGSEEGITGQTATRTVSATDLSGYSTITYWVRSDRTGSFMRFQFGESSSSEQTNTITINSANTWEQKTWDISGISASARDAVTKYAFYVTDASADFDFYFDDIQATISNSPPSTPSLDSPANGATNQSLTPSLLTTATDADSDYLRYKIELCENSGMTTNCQTFDQTSSQTGWSGQNTQSNTAYTSGTQATYTLQTALTPSFTYYWRSYAKDPGGSNTWSSTQGSPRSFTTTTAPSAPTTPWAEGTSNPSGIVDLTPEFSAIHNDSDGDAAVYYEIEVNTLSNFTGTVMWDTGAVSMSSLASGARSSDVSYAGTALSYNGATYYWRIRFTDNKGATGAWSATQNFSTNSPPATPSLDSPSNGATNQSLTPSLLTTATDADSDYLRYKIELCENAAMTTNCQTFDQTSSQTGWSGQNTQSNTAYTSGTQATYTLQTALTPSFTYYWRSYAKDPGGSNTWSSTQGSPYSFTTTGTGTTNFRFEGIQFNGVKIN
jgi:hypothetical protein